uniref:Superoxide dismutase [Cu-Zn] n=1 Tax=Globodera pallida TaxID=36090 RepID=A0A183BRN4_GLOPA
MDEMFDCLLNTNQHWRFVVGAAGVEPDFKAFLDQVKDYFTSASKPAAQKADCVLVGDTDPNVKGMLSFTHYQVVFQSFSKVHCFRAEHGVLNAVFSSSQTLRKFLLPRAVRWQEVRLSKYIILKTMHDRLLSNRDWWYSLIGIASLDEDCKAFMDQLKDYLSDASILKKKAVCVLVGDTDKNVKGMVTFTQDSLSTPVKIVGQISGLSSGGHGFHVHELGDLTNGCATAGPHFNPTNKTHGEKGAFRHVGLLGNVHAGADGVAKFGFTGSGISLSGAHNIVGRTLVVHKLEDVLDHGLHGEKQENKMATGNARPRLSCGVIMIGIGGP